MTPIRFYNTLTNQLEDFTPIDPPIVRMYNCGPTVYDFAHIGNFRAFVFADLLRRFLEFTGHEVRQVMNITDVGHMTEDQLADGGGQDKMELAAQRLKAAKKSGVADVENPDDPFAVARYFEQAFIDDAKALRLKIAEDDEAPRRPRATEHVTQMIAMIEKLIVADHAYVADDGAVYYDVMSFPQYGKLSGNTLDKLAHGAGGRVSETDTAGKRNPHDFLLWKPDAKHLMKWDSPWGWGYPGWHIECSAMSMSALGVETLDIHTGGEDNIFPHHECEIAQSEAFTGQEFARYWMHAKFLQVDGGKMAKSLGNVWNLDDVKERGFEPRALRFALIRGHYRQPLNFTWAILEESKTALAKLDELVRKLQRLASMDNGGAVSEFDDGRVALSRAREKFEEGMCDDLNTPQAISALFELRNFVVHTAMNPVVATECLEFLRDADGVLGVLRLEAEEEDLDADVEALIEARTAARGAKDWAEADRIRDELVAMGIELEDTPEGVVWKRVR